LLLTADVYYTTVYTGGRHNAPTFGSAESDDQLRTLDGHLLRDRDVD